MTDDPLENPGNELTWRRKLNASEEARLRAWLRTYPEAQAQFESETALNEALDSLPNAPVASNFTARVLQAVELEKSRAEQALPSNRVSLFGLLRWLPKTAVAAPLYGMRRRQVPPKRSRCCWRPAQKSRTWTPPGRVRCMPRPLKRMRASWTR